MNETTIPADLLPGLLDGWCGPIQTFEHSSEFGHPAREIVRAHGQDWPGYWRASVAPQGIGGGFSNRLDLTRPEAAWRCCVILAAGETPVPRCGVSTPDGPCDDSENHRGPHQIGNTRKVLRPPAPAWHLLPVKYGGQLPDSLAQHSAALLACHARRVAAGKGGIVDILHPWRESRYRHPPAKEIALHAFRSVLGSEGGAAGCTVLNESSIAENGWSWAGPAQVVIESRWVRGPETGEAGKACADAAAIAAGYVLIDGDTLRVPE